MYKYRTQYPDFSHIKVLFSNRKQNENGDTLFCTSRWRRCELANVMGLSKGVQKDLEMCKMQHALQKRVPSLPVFRKFRPTLKSPNFSLNNGVLLNISENLVKFTNQLTNNHTTKMSQVPIETNGNLHVFSIWYGESC